MTLLLFFALFSLAQSARAVQGPLPPAAAPPGLEVELRTVAHRSTFRLSETIPLEIAFRSSKPLTYSVELAYGSNSVPSYDRFLVQPGDGVIDRVWAPQAIICCSSRRAFLRAAPAVYPYELTDFVRFTAPGEYRVQYSTRRVFTRARTPGENDEPSDLTVRSNVITVTIIDDDPEWLQDALRDALKGVDSPPSPKQLHGIVEQPRHYYQPPGADVTRYLDAGRRLRLLDTPVAIRERVARLRMPSVDEWRTAEADGNGYLGIERSVALSSRPDLVAAALAERASAPEFGVVRDYFELWADVVVERDHPEMVRLLGENEERDWKKYWEWHLVARRDVLETLRRLNAQKTAVGAEITSATIRAVERDLAK